MKKTLFLLTFILLTGFFTKAKSQASCPIITNFNLIPQGPGNWKVIFNYANPTSGNKWVSVEAVCNGTQVLAPSGINCFKVPTDGSSPLYTSVTFACPALANLTVFVRSHTGNECGGTICQVQISAGGSPLPVSFKSFTAIRNKSNVLLKWETTSEINNNGFAIERFINGSWEQIAFLNSQAVNGNSDALLTYTYNDLNNAKGITQYRIKQVDIDSRSKYSEIRSVRGDGQPGKVTIYPNPSNDGKVNVVFEENNIARDIMIVDMSGKTIKQLKGLTNNNVTIDNLNSGMYSLRIVVPATGEQTIQKIIVNKK